MQIYKQEVIRSSDCELQMLIIANDLNTNTNYSNKACMT